MTLQKLFKVAPITCLLLLSFIGLFLIQALTGMNVSEPTSADLIKWGANALPFTMGYEPWRLVSSAFLHIGFMHLLFNGFAMYFFGQVAEPMFGHSKFLVIFLLSAVGGNLLNNFVTWQGIVNDAGSWGLSAGASGGIMGLGAALLIAALFKISVNGLVLNLRSLVFIMGINLVYGFAVPGIDNAGHIGGAITGAIIALAFAIAYRKRHPAALFDPTHQGLINNNPDHSGPISPPPLPSASSLNSTLPTSDYDQEINYSQTSTPVSMAAAMTPNAKTTPSITANKWQLLPWAIILLITISFYLWWLDMHHQIVIHLN
ncbi:MAG: rhomboid family intramembrane serine protease [Psychrobacter sp.]|nr:rhomboid family intramembrane serine protease [Psychrobacter sp.]